MNEHQNEALSREDLESMTRSEIIELAKQVGGNISVLGMSKADMIEIVLTGMIPDPSPEHLMREALLLAQWRRGVPPGEALLKAGDKQWLEAMWNAVQV